MGGTLRRLSPPGHLLRPDPTAGVVVWDRTSHTTAWQALPGDLYGTPEVPALRGARAGHRAVRAAPAYIDVGSAETFRDEDVAYANAIWRAGGRAELHVWPGAFHGFDTFAPGAARSREARGQPQPSSPACLRRIHSANPAGSPSGAGLAPTSVTSQTRPRCGPVVTSSQNAWASCAQSTIEPWENTASIRASAPSTPSSTDSSSSQIHSSSIGNIASGLLGSPPDQHAGSCPRGCSPASRVPGADPLPTSATNDR
ncbi:hypothetical protein E6U81_02185 [Streptomyces sp. A0592]|nr:hypothetical protein E6U81_02185 [Streptomyces sp. A0592]